MSKVSYIIPGPLPVGPLTDGRVILSPSRWTRWFRGPLATSWALVRAVRTNWPEIVAAIRRDQPLSKRLELVSAVMTLGATQNIYSDQGLGGLMGLRHANCACTPGRGHRRRRSISIS